MSKQIVCPMAGTMWKVLVKPGDSIAAGDTVAILESMKMEIPIEAEIGGVVASVQAEEGVMIDEGAPVMTLA